MTDNDHPTAPYLRHGHRLAPGPEHMADWDAVTERAGMPLWIREQAMAEHIPSREDTLEVLRQRMDDIADRMAVDGDRFRAQPRPGQQLHTHRAHSDLTDAPDPSGAHMDRVVAQLNAGAAATTWDDALRDRDHMQRVAAVPGWDALSREDQTAAAVAAYSDNVELVPAGTGRHPEWAWHDYTANRDDLEATEDHYDDGPAPHVGGAARADDTTDGV